MAEFTRMLKAKKQVPAEEVGVECGRPVITPGVGDIKATINFNIKGVEPIDLTSEEEDVFWKWAKPVMGRSKKLNSIEEVKTIDAITPK